MKEKYPMNNLKKIVKAQNKSLTSLAVKLEISQEAISQYISGKIYPKLSTVIKMAKILNTSADYLLGLTDNPTPNNIKLNEKENHLIDSYRKLANIEKVQVDSYIQAIIDLKKELDFNAYFLYYLI